MLLTLNPMVSPLNPRTWIFGLIAVLCSLSIIPYYPHRFAGIIKNADDSESRTIGTVTGPLRILLLTAHPDDEAMFFAPTLFGLNTKTKLENKREPKQAAYELYSLCLSVGDAEGLGEVRRQELGASLDVLGVPEGRRWVSDRFQDNMTLVWDTSQIVDYVEPYVEQNGIDMILTFDERGVSSHPNHISLKHGATTLIAQHKTRLRAFSLKSTDVLAKYTGLFSAMWAMLGIRMCSLKKIFFVESESEWCRATMELSFNGGMEGYVVAIRAMMKHRSQLVWFRWLYFAFSRYMWVNEWVEI